MMTRDNLSFRVQASGTLGRIHLLKDQIFVVKTEKTLVFGKLSDGKYNEVFPYYATGSLKI